MCHKCKHHMAQRRSVYCIFGHNKKMRINNQCSHVMPLQLPPPKLLVYQKKYHAITASKRNACIMKWEINDLTNSNE